MSTTPLPPPPAQPPTPPPVQPPPVQPPPVARSRWWLLPLSILIVGAVLILLLMGLPFGRDDDRRPVERVETETIGEGEAPTTPPETGTLVDLEPTTSPTMTATTATTATIVTTTTAASPTATIPPPTATVQPPAATPPPPVVITQTTGPREISEDEAVNELRGFITSRDYYGIGTRCTSIRSNGYRNAGYTLEVHDRCANRLLGLWRVDSKTREIFRQREDGRYLRP